MLGEDLPLFPCLPQDIFQHSRCTIELDFRTVEIEIYSYLLPSKFFLFLLPDLYELHHEFGTAQSLHVILVLILHLKEHILILKWTILNPSSIIYNLCFQVVIYLKNFAFWLVERDTLDAYTIPKVNELCREKLICVLLDYESAYLGLVGDVNYSREVRFIRGLVCYPTTQYKSLCVWVRGCCCKV